jgi:hypothetical protein
MGYARRLAGGLVLLVLVVFAVGCGDDSSTGAEETEGKEERLYPRVHGPSREFLIPGGDNIVQFYGHEGTPAERKEVSKVIHAWMRARVAEDWAEDCKYFSRRYSRALVADARRVTDGKVQNCPQALEYFGPNASGTSGNTLTGPIDSFRLRERRGYAQWHGPEEDWILPMRREGGKWWVESASPLERTA